MPFIEFASASEVAPRISQVRRAAADCVKALRLLLKNETDAMQALRIMKFEALGYHPLESGRLNLLEQLNQSFNQLVSLEAARWLLERHASLGPIRVNVGALRGMDLESLAPNQIAAKAFAATHPQSNGKLTRDLGHLSRVAPTVPHRYVFLSCPRLSEGRQPDLERGDGIEVWSFPVARLLEDPK